MYGGYWHDNGLFEYRYVRRYPHKCWLLERWIPACHFASPISWAAETANSEGYLSAGPYPWAGVFFCSYLFANPDHSYLPILPDLVLLTAQAIYNGRINRTWQIRDAILSQEEAKERILDEQLDQRWDEAHGVRRGVSFHAKGVIQNNEAEKQAYVERLASSGIQIKREQFELGFRQVE
jgi:hypothetical protein